SDPMALAGHFEKGGEGERAAGYYQRASEQAFQVLDLDATLARAGLGLACSPPPKLRMELLGMRCDAACQALRLVNVTMPDAEELMRTAPPGSIPWAQAAITYNFGTLLAGRINDLLASIARVRDIDPAPGAVGKMAHVILNGIWNLDTLGHVLEGTALE